MEICSRVLIKYMCPTEKLGHKNITINVRVRGSVCFNCDMSGQSSNEMLCSVFVFVLVFVKREGSRLVYKS